MNSIFNSVFAAVLTFSVTSAKAQPLTVMELEGLLERTELAVIVSFVCEIEMTDSFKNIVQQMRASAAAELSQHSYERAMSSALDIAEVTVNEQGKDTLCRVFPTTIQDNMNIPNIDVFTLDE